jgi:hypothetical protein
MLLTLIPSLLLLLPHAKAKLPSNFGCKLGLHPSTLAPLSCISSNYQVYILVYPADGGV